MANDVFSNYESGFNAGFLFASQVVASAIINSINHHPHWMLSPNRNQAIAQIKLTTRYILEKRKLIPTSYQVMRGIAEDVPLNFDLFIY